MADWRKVLDSLKAEAKRKETAELPSLQGKRWETEEHYYYSAPRQEIDEVVKYQATRIVKGWVFVMSINTLEGERVWWLSASLYPKGRSLTEKDRKWLSSLTRYLEAPCKPMLEHANQHVLIHWSWTCKENR